MRLRSGNSVMMACVHCDKTTPLTWHTAPSPEQGLVGWMRPLTALKRQQRRDVSSRRSRDGRKRWRRDDDFLLLPLSWKRQNSQRVWWMLTWFSAIQQNFSRFSRFLHDSTGIITPLSRRTERNLFAHALIIASSVAAEGFFTIMKVLQERNLFWIIWSIWYC